MMLQCFPDIQYSKISEEHSIRFQTSHRKPVANVRAFEVKSSATLKPLSLATVLIYQHTCMNLSAELAWYCRYEASQPVSFRSIRQFVPASHVIRTVGTVCLYFKTSIQGYWPFRKCKL
ncbi:hypothetical protein ACJEEO_04560 [Phocaeicola coprocola]|uniref:hypothetical protein n=1 Tax=Bacteroidaceae TaxID=815 RepID=UPI00195837A4|nr:hypothetical protein [Phocaeicola coprocola]MBM6714238.1 hypothetical protein [Phocaeicola coprocola]